MKKTVYNIIINGLYQVFVILIPIITVPYVSRVLGTYYLGEYSYYGNIVNFLGVLIVFGLGQQGTKKIAEVKFEDRRSTFNELWYFQIIAGVVTTVAYLATLLFPGFNHAYLLLFLPYLLSYVFDISWFYIGIGEIKKVVLRNMLVKVVTLILIFAFVKTKDDFYLYIIFNSIGIFASNIVFLYSLHQFLPPKIKRWVPKINKEYLRSGLILLVPQIAVQVYTSLDKVIVGNIAGQVELSYYDQSQKIARIVLALVTSLSIVLMPKMVNMEKDSKNLYRLLNKSADYTLMIAGLMAVGLMVNTKSFVPWFFGKEFIPMTSNMLWTSLIIIFISYGGVFANQYTLAKGMFKLYSIPYLVGAVVDVVLNLILVPKFSSMGGTMALVITEGIVCALRIILLRKQLNVIAIFSNEKGIVISTIITFLFGYFLRIELASSILTMAISAISMTLVFMICIWLLFPPFRSDFKAIVQLLKNKFLSKTN